MSRLSTRRGGEHARADWCWNPAAPDRLLDVRVLDRPPREVEEHCGHDQRPENYRPAGAQPRRADEWPRSGSITSFVYFFARLFNVSLTASRVICSGPVGIVRRFSITSAVSAKTNCVNRWLHHLRVRQAKA